MMTPLCEEGILLIDKPERKTSFSVVADVRKKTGVKKVGHTGTLDPFATGLLIVLLGQSWTRKADLFLHHDKEYEAVLFLGKATDTLDCDGKVIKESPFVPSETEIRELLASFQGMYMQTPPMFSAKKIDGTRLYKLARRGIEIERSKTEVRIETTFVRYEYPYLSLTIKGSKGTYIRSLAEDFGERLGCFAYVSSLRRLRSGPFHVEHAISRDHCLSLSHEQINKRLLRSL